jgi:hypothetical protein
MSFGTRLQKEFLIHPSDRLVGSVPLVHGQPNEKEMQTLLDKLAQEPTDRDSVIKTWMGPTVVEVYVSRRMSA